MFNQAPKTSRSNGLPPNRLGVPRDKRSKRSKKGGKMRNLLVGLENRYASISDGSIVFFFSSIEKKKTPRANARDFPESGPVRYPCIVRYLHELCGMGY
jgi:hypothetical protein